MSFSNTLKAPFCAHFEQLFTEKPQHKIFHQKVLLGEF